MALPELMLPAGMPAFLANDHDLELAPLHAEVEMRTGHSLKRRVFTVADRQVGVALQLTAALMTTFEAWFETALQAGVLPFTAQVANQGAGLLYWSARFVGGSYVAVASEGGASFVVWATLRLTGDGSATPPASSSLAGDITVPLVGSAVLLLANTLAGDITVPLQTASNNLAGDVTVALSGFHGFLARESSGNVQREDGSFIERE